MNPAAADRQAFLASERAGRDHLGGTGMTAGNGHFDGTTLKALQETETALSAYAHALEQQQGLREASEQACIAAGISRA